MERDGPAESSSEDSGGIGEKEKKGGKSMRTQKGGGADVLLPEKAAKKRP